MQQLEAYPFTSVLTYDEHGWPQLDRAVTSEVLRNVLRSYYTNGVFGTTDTSCLQVTADTSGTSVQVAPGTALIQGATGYSESTTILPLSANSNTLPRIDTVVVRLNDNSDYRGIYLDIIEGTPAATPAAPTLTRGDSIWELGLANIYRAGNSTAITNSNITDTRMDPDRCGYTAAAIELDTSAFYNQLQAAYGEYTTYVENLIAELDELIDEGVASGLQAQIDTIDGDTPWYATSDTAAATAAKVATTNDEVFVLAAGAKVVVKFDNTNTAAAPTLNVDGTGAKSIKAYGTTAPTVWWKAGDVVSFVYDGTNWIMGVTAGEIEKITGDISQINSDLTDKASVEYVDGLVKTDIQTLTFTNGFRRYVTPYKATRVESVIGDGGYVVAASISGINSLYLYVANNTTYSGNITVRIKYI